MLIGIFKTGYDENLKILDYEWAILGQKCWQA